MSLITINNQYIGAVTWSSSKLCDFSVTGQVEIWQIDVSRNTQHIDTFLQVLEPAEIIRADKYYKESDRNRFIISRGSLRYILSAYLNTAPEIIRFGLEENKKPFIIYPATSQLHFNLSDSADRILTAVSNSPVGIDVELIKQGFRYHDILKNNFNPPEGDYINLANSYNRFFLLWTRKEAILKATGIGLTDHLKQIPSLDGEHQIDGKLLLTETSWQSNSFEPAPGYTATITSEPAIGLRFFDFNFY